MYDHYNPAYSIKQAKINYCRKSNPSGPGPCPKCGAFTKVVYGMNGKFWGCINFPICNGSRNWE